MPVVTWTDDGAGNPISGTDESDQLAGRRPSSLVARNSQAWVTWSPILNGRRSLDVAKLIGFAAIAPPDVVAVAKLIGYAVITPAPFWRRQGPWQNPPRRSAAAVQDCVVSAPATLYGSAAPFTSQPAPNPPPRPRAPHAGFTASLNVTLVVAAGDEVVVTAIW
jgi:hypothetical protein